MSESDRVANHAGPQETFDVCIIGAGAAGLVLGELLTRDGSVRVCLLEAGPERFSERAEPYRVRSTLREHLGVNEARVTAFGGATNTWGGGLMRLSPADFEAIEGRPDTAWPIPYESLVPHYQAIEQMFGFTAAPEGPGNIFLERDDLLVRRREIPVLPFRAKNFAHRFGPALRKRSNMVIVCNTDIVRFCPATDSRLSHLVIRTRGQPPRCIAARDFVLAAGIVNTNLLAERVLEAFGAAEAFADHGRYFHDHLSVPLARVRPASASEFSRRFGYRFERGMMFGEHFDIETKRRRLPGGFFHLVFDTSGSSILRPVRSVLNAIQQRTIRGQDLPSLRELSAMFVGLPRLGMMRYLHRRLYLDHDTAIIATLDTEQFPRREWRLHSDGVEGGCSVAWDIAPEDLELVARYVPVCHEILRQLRAEGAFEVEQLSPDPRSDPGGFREYVKSKAVDALHSAGGLRMGGAAESLVHPDLRLNGVRNVYVLSLSVFPRVGTSNPTLTLLALGHRLAQSLRAGRLEQEKI